MPIISRECNGPVVSEIERIDLFIWQDCVGVEPVWWSYAGNGHRLEELEYGVMECLWHVFNKHSWNVVGAKGFVAREESDGFVENGGGRFADDHVLLREGGG